MILVTGATGSLGSAIINELLKSDSGEKIGALVRDKNKAESLVEKGIEIFEADYDTKAKLVEIFAKAEKLVFISGNADTDTRIVQHKNVVEAAIESGIKQIYYTSFSNPVDNTKFTFTKAHTETEKMIKNSGVNYTFLRDALYADLLLGSAQEAANTGKITTASATGKVGYIPRFEIATAVATIVSGNSHVNQAVELVGSKTYSYQDVAEMLSKILDKNITLNLVSTDEIEKIYVGMGLPEFLAKGLASSFNAIEDGEYNFTSDHFKKIVGRNPIDLPSYLESSKSYFMN